VTILRKIIKSDGPSASHPSRTLRASYCTSNLLLNLIHKLAFTLLINPKKTSNLEICTETTVTSTDMMLGVSTYRKHLQRLRTNLIKFSSRMPAHAYGALFFARSQCPDMFKLTHEGQNSFRSQRGPREPGKDYCVSQWKYGKSGTFRPDQSSENTLKAT